MKMDTPSTTITATPSRRAIYPINAPPSFVAPRPCLPHWCPGHRHITGDRGSPVPWHWLLSDEPVLRVPLGLGQGLERRRGAGNCLLPDDDRARAECAVRVRLEQAGLLRGEV